MPKDEISEEVRAGWRRMKPRPNPNEEAHRRFMASINKERLEVKTREVAFSIDEEFINALQTRIGAKNVVDVLQEALAMLDWAAKERDNGRFVISTNDLGGEIHRLVMPALKPKE